MVQIDSQKCVAPFFTIPMKLWEQIKTEGSELSAILYPVSLISFGVVFVQAFRGGARRFVALPFAINIIAN